MPVFDRTIQSDFAVVALLDALFVRYDVPLRDGSRYTTWTVNWPAFADTEAKREGTSGKAKLLRSFRSYSGAVGPTVVGKYTNTLAFADMVWRSTDACPS